MSDDKKRRVIVPRWTAADEGITPEDVRDAAPTAVIPATSIVRGKLRPEIGSMIDDAYWLVKDELRLLRSAQGEGKKVDATRLEKLVRSLEKLQTAEMKEEARENPVEKPDDELLREAMRDPQLRSVMKQLLAEYETEESNGE